MTNMTKVHLLIRGVFKGKGGRGGTAPNPELFAQAKRWEIGKFAPPPKEIRINLTPNLISKYAPNV